MSEFADFDLDRSVSRAWKGFQARLADYLVAMTDEDSLVIGVAAGEEPEGGTAPYVQFAGFGGDHLRGEVSGNGYLAAEFRLDNAAERALAQQGWTPPDESRNHFVHVPTADGDRLAVMAVQALRDVFDVPHPAFLTTGDERAAARLGLTGAPVESEPASDEPLAVIPESPEHLQELVDRALTPLFGHPPSKDEDGDIPVPYNSTLVFVRVYKDEPLIDIFGSVVTGVTDLEAARVEVGILNRDVKFIKFVVMADRVLAQVQIPSYPFAPQVLRTLLQFMSQALDALDDDLALRTGGRPAIDPVGLAEVEGEEDVEDEEDAEGPEDDELELSGAFVPESASVTSTDLHPALQTIMQLDADGEGDLDPELVADICDRDRELVLALLHRCGREEIAWSQAAEAAVLAGDEEEGAACEQESRAWEATTEVLRRALRVVARGGRR